MNAYTGKVIIFKYLIIKYINDIFKQIPDRNAGAVMHSHGKNIVLASLIFGSEFKVKNLEMIKVRIFDNNF